MVTQYKFYGYGDTVNYKKFDIFIDPVIARYYYATQDNVNEPITSYYTYQISSFSRTNDIITLYYTKTGSGPNFAPGSLIVATGQSDATAYYTGMVIEATPNYLLYQSAGPDINSSTVAGKINTVLNPCWTTGFYFIPSYSTSFEAKNKTIISQFGDGYSQRQRDGINSVQYNYNTVFENRSDKETRAILNFVQDKGGVEPIKLLMPVSALSNDPSLKYVCSDAKVSTQNYNSNNISLTLTQVFDQE